MRSSLRRLASVASLAEPPPDPRPFYDSLVNEVAGIATLGPSEERQVSELVERLTGYVNTHAVEPPVVPALASRMLELLRQPEIDLHELARLIERDQATAARLMSIANSALYRGRSAITTIRDAIVFLGTQQVAQIAMALASRTLFESASERSAQHDERFPRLFAHAMTTAFASVQLAARRKLRHSESAFLGGLFHDVGKAVALRALIDMAASEDRPAPTGPIADAALYMMHAEPSSVLYESWRLPEPLMLMCRHHHRLAANVNHELHFVRIVSALDTLRAGAEVEKREALQELDESTSVLRMRDPELRATATETHSLAARVAQMVS